LGASFRAVDKTLARNPSLEVPSGNRITP
jgi:hypothetical protein